MTKMRGSKSESGSISQRHAADPDPDPHQNVMDLQHDQLFPMRTPPLSPLSFNIPPLTIFPFVPALSSLSSFPYQFLSPFQFLSPLHFLPSSRRLLPVNFLPPSLTPHFLSSLHPSPPLPSPVRYRMVTKTRKQLDRNKKSRPERDWITRQK
jgi:hypothetical protein